MTPIQEFDHSVIAVNDLILAQRFYSEVLGEIVGRAELDVPTLMTTEEVVRSVRLRERMMERDFKDPSRNFLELCVGREQA